DEVGLRALNDALRAAFDAPGRAGFGRGGAASDEQPIERQQPRHTVSAPPAPPSAASSLEGAMRVKQSPIRLHPGAQRRLSLLFDPTRVRPGTPIEVATDPGLSL